MRPSSGRSVAARDLSLTTRSASPHQSTGARVPAIGATDGMIGESVSARARDRLATEGGLFDLGGFGRFGRAAGAGSQISLETTSPEIGAGDVGKERMSAIPSAILSASAAAAAPGRRGIHAGDSSAPVRGLNRPPYCPTAPWSVGSRPAPRGFVPVCGTGQLSAAVPAARLRSLPEPHSAHPGPRASRGAHQIRPPARARGPIAGRTR